MLNETFSVIFKHRAFVSKQSMKDRHLAVLEIKEISQNNEYLEKDKGS